LEDSAALTDRGLAGNVRCEEILTEIGWSLVELVRARKDPWFEKVA
jgi:hypothetical protein